jgi:hypothetical protein
MDAAHEEILRRVAGIECRLDELTETVQDARVDNAVQTEILRRIEDGRIPVGKNIAAGASAGALISVIAAALQAFLHGCG